MPTPMKGVRLPRNVERVTFVQSKESFVFNDFGKAVNNTTVSLISRFLRLESDLDDFKRLHDEDLRPAWVDEKTYLRPCR